MSYTKEDLKLYFELLDLPVEDWGTGEAKTLEHLLKELEKGECRINGVLRETHSVILDVYCGKEKLHEDRQVFVDGRVRKRILPWGSVGEKLMVGEMPIRGLWRGLWEELKVGYDYNIRIKFVGEMHLLKRSASYPGFVTKTLQYRYIVKLPKHLYRPEGYVEVQEDKTTYFVWIPARSE